VNVAARLEALAEPGGICVARTVFNHVQDKVDTTFEDLGDQEVKNIPKPVQVFKVLLDSPATEPATVAAAKARQSLRWPMVAGSLVVLVIVAVAILWQRPWEPREEPASIEAMAFPLPDKPSIAVLPFNNMSDDASQEYFADGMAEDLITDLSKNPELFVIARNSSFVYKGQAVPIKQVAEELGVRYVLEGSVRRAGEEVRINAQLIDATTGGHLWAERYDGTLADVFDLQDKITEQIVAALAVSLGGGTETEVSQVETESPEAYDAFLQGWDHYRRSTPEDFAKSIPYFKQAIQTDPDYGRAHAALAAVYWNSMRNGWERSLDLSQSQSSVLSQRYLQEAKKRPTALMYQVSSELAAAQRRKPDKALAEAERAIAMDANDPGSYLAMANALIKAGKPAEAVDNVQTAMRLDPHYPASYLTRLAEAQFAMGQLQDAAATLERAANRNPNDDWTFVHLAAAYGHLGREQEAKEAVKKANVLRAKAGWDNLTLAVTSLNEYVFRRTGDKKSLREGLVKAGVKTPSAEWVQLVSTGEMGFEVEGATTIDVATAKALHDRGVPFVDTYYGWIVRHVPGAHFLEIVTAEFTKARLSRIVNKDEGVVIYGVGGNRRWPVNASAMAVIWGFEKVYFFRDGIEGWMSAGHPVEKWKAD
jgi:TolB-like protein/thioredoxin-like negative regulator of GroEL